MRFIVPSSILALGAVTFGQNLNGLPMCAQTVALTAAANSGCASLTAECLCQNSGFVASLQAAIQDSCSGTDQQTACAWGNSACSAYGVSIPCGISSNAAVTTSSTNPDGSTTMSDNGGGATMAATIGMGPTSNGNMGMTGMTSVSITVSATMMTTTMIMNGTMTHTSTMNSTHLSRTSAKPTSSKITSGATSQYTGAASAAGNGRSGIAGIFASVLLFSVLF